MSDLRALAERYIELETEIATVRSEMLTCLTNGHGAEVPSPRPPTNARRHLPPGKQRKGQAESRIVELLKTEAMGPAAIARAMNAKTSTTDERLRR
jgi:hypothetical protein